MRPALCGGNKQQYNNDGNAEDLLLLAAFTAERD